MSRQLEQQREDVQVKKDRAILVALEYGLADDVSRGGAVLLGFSARLVPGECLLTLRGDLAGRRQICFVAAADLTGAILKACRLGRSDRLRWRADKFAGD